MRLLATQKLPDRTGTGQRMSSFSPTIHLSPLPSFREHTCDSAGMIMSQSGCQAQICGTELTLEMSEAEYSHLQHLIRADTEAHAADSRGPKASAHPAAVMFKDASGFIAISPLTSTQAVDLSASADEQCSMAGERTPACYGEVPAFVLAKVKGEDGPTEPRAKSRTSSHMGLRSAARVCLEKRFNTMSPDTQRQQDVQSSHSSNFWTVLEQTAEAYDGMLHPQVQKWMRTTRANGVEVSSPLVGGGFSPATSQCEHVISNVPHVADPSHQGLIIPKRFSFNLHSYGGAIQSHHTSGNNSTEGHHLSHIENIMSTPAAASREPCDTHNFKRSVTAKATPDSVREPVSRSAKRPPPHASHSQRREKHNRKERERRKKIRLCCDELNMLVPFCQSDSDRATTLQWTTAFLRYINKTYGDTFKEEFKKTVAGDKGLFLIPSSSSAQNSVQQQQKDTLSITLAAEQ